MMTDRVREFIQLHTSLIETPVDLINEAHKALTISNLTNLLEVLKDSGVTYDSSQVLTEYPQRHFLYSTEEDVHYDFMGFIEKYTRNLPVPKKTFNQLRKDCEKMSKRGYDIQAFILDGDYYPNKVTMDIRYQSNEIYVQIRITDGAGGGNDLFISDYDYDLGYILGSIGWVMIDEDEINRVMSSFRQHYEVHVK